MCVTLSTDTLVRGTWVQSIWDIAIDTDVISYSEIDELSPVRMESSKDSIWSTSLLQRVLWDLLFLNICRTASTSHDHVQHDFRRGRVDETACPDLTFTSVGNRRAQLSHWVVSFSFTSRNNMDSWACPSFYALKYWSITSITLSVHTCSGPSACQTTVIFLEIRDSIRDIIIDSWKSFSTAFCSTFLSLERGHVQVDDVERQKRSLKSLKLGEERREEVVYDK